ncbi:UNVERIFIED_CONTAM: NTE family protein [Acetivibrio alkalicellulosi]
MFIKDKVSNLILSGGGIKGIAYVGALETFEYRGWRFLNVAGVSAGAIVGTIVASGYSAFSLRGILNSLNLEKIKGSDIVERVPIISDYIDLCKRQAISQIQQKEMFFKLLEFHDYKLNGGDYIEERCSILNQIIKFCKQGYIYDGDYLEEWMSQILLRRGIKTFGDLRGGVVDRVNPRGYRIRMTAVDASRGKIVVLPDDILYYGIDPDSFEVAKAVRMSISVPFVFKPVQIKRNEGGTKRTHYFVDGGVFDNFPFWLIDTNKCEKHSPIPVVGMRLIGKKSTHGLNVFNILKNFISYVHDIGVPKNIMLDPKNTIKINTSDISFLDFDLNEDEVSYLVNSGVKSVLKFLEGNRRGNFNYPYFNGIAIILALLIKKIFKT